MGSIDNVVYATLLMNDAYLPGAMVLGHSLKDKGAKGKLVVLVLVDKVSATTISDLKTIYDDVVPVQQIMNKAPANLYLMNRPDLISAFTKIQLWKQTQYKRIVYMDADVVALRAPNELLTMDTEFAAVPDIGWPDCFNSGVMVLNPNMADYYALLALAERGISFDGADQGLLNMHFTEWERLSFKYNCTPSGNYQYVPAYRHFQSTINLVHFIGRDKPWTLGRQTRYDSGVYGELLGRWWAVFDKHYRGRETIYYEEQYPNAPKKVQDYVSGEETMYFHSSQAPPPVIQVHAPESVSASTAEQPIADQPTVEEQILRKEFEPTPTVEQRRWSAPHAEWEPSRMPPPVNSKPEAANFPSQVYDFSDDVKLFQPPTSYPEAPKDMWYQVPAKPAPQPKLKPLFPWEERAPKPTRVFLQQSYTSPHTESFSPRGSITTFGLPDPLPARGSTTGFNEPSESTGLTHAQSAPRTESQKSEPPTQEQPRTDSSKSIPTERPVMSSHPMRDNDSRSSSVTDQTEPVQTPIEEYKEQYVSPWEALKDRTNVWDDMPEIAQYVQALQPPRKGAIQVLHHTPSTNPGDLEEVTSPTGPSGRRQSLRITDFPTAVERPSLPVTPAPIRRPTFWGDENEMSGELPNADGVPKQDEWNPFARLEELQRLQSEMILGRDNIDLIKEPPKRELPDSASLEAVEAAVNKATSPTSTRPLKPILKEPKFEVSNTTTFDPSATMMNTIHNAVTEDVDPLSAGEDH